VITWDKNFPYFNGHQHYLWGMSGRYNYPALGSAVPDELLWKDVKLTADCGGRIWRPGHSTCAHEFVEAGDAFGVMIDQPSGEGEGAFSTTAINASKITLKSELHRDMIVRDRNNPSVLMWEVSNAGIDPAFAGTLKALALTWDPISKRPQADRGYLEGCRAGVSDIIECSSSACVAGQKLNPDCVNYPAFGSESWGTRGSRWAWDYELQIAGEYIQDWKNEVKANVFGIAHWYLAEAPGEVGGFLGQPGTARSFGSSAMDANRIPKLLYHIYRVAWTPYAVKPGVALAHHWNRSGTVRVNAFSNCPKVRLLLNGTSLGEKTPNPELTASDDKTQTSTSFPYQCWWDVAWAAGTLRAEGLDAGGAVVCSDEKKTAGAPHHIVLTVDPRLVKPDGSVFNITANGTDVATILAKVVDQTGIWCPTASNLVTFNAAGPCEYRGGTDAFVTAGQGFGYHAPLDHELMAEGGMCKVAIRSTFTTGAVNVTATSPNLGQGTASYTVYPVTSPTSVYRPASLAAAASVSVFKIGTMGGMVRYYIGTSANVAVDILDAHGRALKSVPNSMQAAGWHPVQFSGTATGDEMTGNGIYFVRCAVDGKSQAVKRVLLIR
jgi:hypothetical protein